MDERVRLPTRYLQTGWKQLEQQDSEISSLTSGTRETSSLHATSTCEMELGSHFSGNLRRIDARKRLFLVKKKNTNNQKTKPTIYCHLLFIAFSVH